MRQPARTRRPWGALWAAAPWDGRPRPPLPAVSEVTPSGLTVAGIPPAAPVPADGPPARRLRRAAFGALLRAAPWAAPPPPRDVSDPLLETTLIPAGARR